MNEEMKRPYAPNFFILLP